VPGVVHNGEGGLLGLAFLEASPGTRTSWLYAYETTASDNRIVRMSLGDQFTLGPPHVILAGLASANHHDGGRIAFGPDGMLYATVGDAGDTSHAQDLSSLNGKILRMTPTGGAPKNNPFPGSLIWSYGHPQPAGAGLGRQRPALRIRVRAEHLGRVQQDHGGRELRLADRRGHRARPAVRRSPWCSGRPTTPARAA
jgi:Glucose/sorbosone dehydrogenases